MWLIHLLFLLLNEGWGSSRPINTNSSQAGAAILMSILHETKGPWSLLGEHTVSHCFMRIYHLLKVNMNTQMPVLYNSVCAVCMSVFVEQILFIPTPRFMYDKRAYTSFQFPWGAFPAWLTWVIFTLVAPISDLSERKAFGNRHWCFYRWRRETTAVCGVCRTHTGTISRVTNRFKLVGDFSHICSIREPTDLHCQHCDFGQGQRWLICVCVWVREREREKTSNYGHLTVDRASASVCLFPCHVWDRHRERGAAEDCCLRTCSNIWAVFQLLQSHLMI